MDRSHLQSRAVVLCLAALLHVTVIAALLQNRTLGVTAVAHPNAHFQGALRSPAMIVSLESALGGEGVQIRAPIGALADKSLRSVPFDVPDPAPISLPPEHSADTMRAQALSGSVGIRCEVHIHQSLEGQVQAIDFGLCTGDAQWQRSLIQSIERAAELVRPPAGASFPPVRTFSVVSDSVSPVLLARQLSEADSSVSEPGGAYSARHEKRSDVNAASN